MNNRSEATTQVSPLFCQNVVRNPSMFSGEISEDPQAWLKGYERVARHNHWDDSLSLANVYFYLHGTAQRWYENNEENIPSWEIFKDQLGSVFGKKDNLRRQAEQKLKVRAQTRGETTEFYIQDVLRLCREVDAQMPEEEKLSHLMKGVAEEVYRYLLPRDIATTDQFIAECRRVVALQGRRVTASKFERLPNVTSLGDLGDVTDLQSLIRQIVREEVQRALAPPREEPRISSLEEIVKEEVDKVLAPMSGINTFPMESAARSAPRNYRKNTWYAPKTRKFPWSQCYKTSQPVSSAFTIGKLRAAPSNGGEAAAQPIIPPLSTVVKMSNNYIDIKVEGDTIRALVDSGASYSVISERFRVELKKTMFAETDVVLKVADDKVVKSKGRCTLKLEVNGHPENFEFVVLENCSHDVILGWDFFKATNAVIDCGLGELQLDDLPDLDAEGRDDGVYAIQDFVIPGRSSQRISVVNRSLVGIVNMEVTCSKELFIRKDVIFPSSLIEFEEGIGKIWITNGGLQPQMIPKGMNLGRMCDIETEHVCLLSVEPESFSRERREDDHSDYLLSLINPDLPKKKKEDLMGLLLSFKGVFLPTMKNANKVQNRVKHRIHTGDHPPIKQRPYRVSKREREIMQKEVDTMLERKVIQPSESPWSAPVVLVKKKDGTWRFCVDFRRLNHITKKDVYPLPRIDDVLDHLSSARYYSTMDLKTGYWQVEVDERDREKTAFVTPDGLYEFMVMPFGLCNAPATFERMMDNVLMGLKWNICLCYLDDIVVYSDTFEEHLERLSKVLSCLQQAGLTINPDKCLFGSTRIKILGHVADKDGIQPDSEKVEAIKKFPVPKSVCDIQSYLGLCSYYRRFIKNFSKIAAPLQILLKKDQKFIWTQEQKDSFESLKKALMQKPVLGHFKESAITKLHTDASSYGLGAVLVQIQENQENPIAYASRTLSKAEKNYSTTERECLAVIWAIGKFRPYLYGRPFEVVSDHHSLCWLAGLKDPSGRLARWALKLQDFDATITYKSGVKHKDADCLSRYPLPESPALTSLTLVREQQNLDPDITKISNALNQGEGAERFEMKNGLLYKRNFDPLGRRLLLVIPKCMRPDILKEFHDVPTAGHLGFARTYDRIRKRYFWPGLYNSVRRYVAHCKECQRRKGENKLPAGKLIPIQPPSFPFQKIGMDLLGRFPLSDKGNRWIIVCTDYLTKYAIAKALPSGTAAEIATFILEEVILKHGAPREIITDRGRAFMSQMVKEVTSRCKISHLFTTAYHPQTNGLTERLNKTLGDMLSMYVDAEQRDWDSVLPYVIFAYNTAQQGSTRFSPFFLVHGREAETLLDVLLPYEDETSDHDFGDQMVTKAEEARQLARIHILRAQENNKYHYDQVHRSVEYRVGDLVWVFTPVRKTGLSEKLLKKYFGPYKITRKVSEVNYEVEALEQSSRRRRRSQKDVVHVLRMKPYRDPGQQLSVLFVYLKKKTLPCLFFLLKNMTYLAKVRKCDLSKLAYELGEVVPPESRIVDLKRLILNSQSYEEEFAKQLLETLIEEREQTERAERERMEQTAQTEQAERIERERIEDRKRIEDRERIERKEQMVMEFELEKLRIQTTRGNNDTSRSTSNDAHYEIRKLMPKYESKDNDLSFYLILFERQAKRLGLDEDQWAFSLLGLLPYEMTQLIARETEEQSGDYRFVKRLLLKRYKLSPEQFRQKFEKHERSQKGSWRDFAFELRGYFNEWIEGMNVENFDALKDLSVTNQLKKKVPNVLRNHLIDDWTKLNNPDELADKLDEYENVRTEMGPPHWNAKHLIPPSFQQKSARFPNQSEVKETKQGTNVSGQDAARNEISETYPNTLRRMVNRAIRNDKGEPKCFNCNQFGHIARDCPAPRTTLTCRGCGQTGHKERNCTRPKEGLKVANLEVEGLETVPPDVYLKDVKIDNKETVKAMIDTGSSSCLMRESVARRISVDIEPDSTSLYGIGNQTAPAARTVGKTTVDLEIDGIVGKEIAVFIVNDDAQPYDLLIGRTWTDLPYVSFARIGVDDACVDSLLEVVDGKTTVPIISAGKGKLRVRKNQCVGRVELLNLDDIVVNLDVAEDSFQTKNEEKREGQDQMKRKRPILPEDINVNHSLTSKERQEILDVVNEYRDCFALGMEELGCTDVTKMDIKEVDGSKPVCLRPYKTTASEREAIREIVREWKDNGIVTETRSPYASPVLLVRKKTGDHRLVVDYRRLNIQTVKDKFPLPRIDDLLEGLRNAKFFTTLDLAHGYLQIPLTDKAKLKTAFITPDDTGQFERMIFGLANAPAEFQRLMHTVLGPLLNKKAFCYLDDVIIPAKDWREMIERLREVLERIRSAKLTLKPSKCEFGRREVEFLGYVISTGGLKPGPRKIKAIEEFPEPKNVHDIRRFLGLTNFFRRFVKDFARKAEPLSRLTKKGSQFEWKEEQRRSFGGLRKDLVEYPVLAHYNPELKTEVHCDASAEGLAGMVLQMDEDCKWRLVYCVSKKTTEAEKMYHSSKLELMAIVWTLDRLRQFLVGIKFTVVTDCQALVYMNAKKTTNPQIARWYNLIQEYDFEIRHKPGEKMAHVDGMSRAPVDDPRDTMEEIVEKNLEVCPTITLEEQILMIQHSDPELRDLIQIFRKDPCDRTVGEQNRINDYSYKGGRLFRMVKNGEEERGARTRLPIPHRPNSPFPVFSSSANDPLYDESEDTAQKDIELDDSHSENYGEQECPK
ncbi:hypothetical protein LAZ67_20000902, partial [Cordylochernes scorpioides]